MSIDTRETSLTDFYLPPGLLLPGPDEPTDRFRVEFFNHSHHDGEALAQFGSFVTALIVFATPETDRVSMMPRRQDIGKLFGAGYGFTTDRLENDYGGIRTLQAMLGFMPEKFIPPKDVIVDRLKWLASNLPADKLPDGQKLNIKSIERWGSQRNLLPYKDGLEESLGGEKKEVMYRIFGIEKPNTQRHYSVRDTFKIGRAAINRHHRPPTKEQFNEDLKETLLYDASTIIAVQHGNLGNFWAEFGYYPDSKGIKRERMLDLGVRYAIKNRGVPPTRSVARDLSRQVLFPTDVSIASRFDNGFQEFQTEVKKHYRKFRFLAAEMSRAGISKAVVEIVSNSYISNGTFEADLLENKETLCVLSEKTDESTYLRSLLVRGFDLESDMVYDLQLEDLRDCLEKCGITNEKDWRFLLRFMPRVGIDETIAEVNHLYLSERNTKPDEDEYSDRAG